MQSSKKTDTPTPDDKNVSDSTPVAQAGGSGMTDAPVKKRTGKSASGRG